MMMNDGCFFCSLSSSAPKAYGYATSDGKERILAKGIRMNYIIAQQVNLSNLEQMVREDQGLTQVWSIRAFDCLFVCCKYQDICNGSSPNGDLHSFFQMLIREPDAIQRNKYHEVFLEDRFKVYRTVFKKRCILQNGKDTLPYGYCF